MARVLGDGHVGEGVGAGRVDPHQAHLQGRVGGLDPRAGPERMRPESRYELRRIPVERDVCRDWFEGMLALPEVFCYRSRSRL